LPLIAAMPVYRFLIFSKGPAGARQGAWAMPIYRFRILDKFDRVIAGQYSHRIDDDATRDHANIFAAEIKNLSVEIWNDQRQVPRKRPNASTVADDGDRSKTAKRCAIRPRAKGDKTSCPFCTGRLC
jgi:hypothetical protein